MFYVSPKNRTSLQVLNLIFSTSCSRYFSISYPVSGSFPFIFMFYFKGTNNICLNARSGQEHIVMQKGGNVVSQVAGSQQQISQSMDFGLITTMVVTHPIVIVVTLLMNLRYTTILILRYNKPFLSINYSEFLSKMT